MRRSVSIRFATVILAIAMAMPVMAAPRDDSAIDRFDRAISRFIDRVTHTIFDLTDLLTTPK